LHKGDCVALSEHQPSLSNSDDVFVPEAIVSDGLIVDEDDCPTLWHYRIATVFPPNQSVSHGYVPIVVERHIAPFISPNGHDMFVNDEFAPFHPTR
jgi:hypothetical protein